MLSVQREQMKLIANSHIKKVKMKMFFVVNIRCFSLGISYELMSVIENVRHSGEPGDTGSH